MSSPEDVSLDTFRLWNSSALKSYLSLRKLSPNGTFDELTARAFCAWEQNVAVDICGEHAERKLLQEYKKKLVIGDKVYQDPFSLQEGWLKEKEGLTKWPSIYFMDIANYLNSKTPQELITRLMNEYKEGKAYRYFSCEWVKEIHYHNICDNSSVCILKADVCPSQSVNNKPYQVWALIDKDQENRPGGRIISAYCTCTAGMLGSCNHVAGMFFRVEAAVKTGMTKLTCTSKSSTWNVPTGKTKVKPVRVTDHHWGKDHYQKGIVQTVNQTTMEMKKSFTPLTKQQELEVGNCNKIRQKLLKAIKPGAGNSCFVQLLEKKRFEMKTVTCPPSLVDTARTIQCNSKPKTENELLKLQEEYLGKIKVSQEEKEELERATASQSVSAEWRRQRHGRITASCFHRVSTRVNTLRKDATADPLALIKMVMGYTETLSTSAMKHGLSMEPHAKIVYSSMMSKRHKKFITKATGISLLQDKSYISASADMKTECNCCGQGLCEIKCPDSIKDQAPTTENVPYLYTDSDGNIQLKKTHSYYYQIQGQMGVLGRKHCDLFVYTAHGNATIRVPFVEDFWCDLLQQLDWFWKTYISRELLTQDILNGIEPADTPMSREAAATLPETCPPSCSSSKNNASKRNQSRKRRTGMNRRPIYLCGVCGDECVDDPEKGDQNSIQCDACALWIHFICAGINSGCEPQSDDSWICSKCA